MDRVCCLTLRVSRTSEKIIRFAVLPGSRAPDERLAAIPTLVFREFGLVPFLSGAGLAVYVGKRGLAVRAGKKVIAAHVLGSRLE